MSPRAMRISTGEDGFLATAITNASSPYCQQQVRVLFDPGSQVSMISERLVSALRLKHHHRILQYEGINASGTSKYVVDIDLSSIHPSAESHNITVSCHVVPKLGTQHPPPNADQLLQLPCIRGKKPLADPELGGPVDIFLGVGAYFRCLKGPCSTHPDYEGGAVPTTFGWALLGAVPETITTKSVLKVQKSDDQLDKCLEHIYDLDQVMDSSNANLTAAEQSALDQFNDTYEVLSSGRFMVKLSRIENPPILGESRPTALSRFHQNEISDQEREIACM